MKEPRYAKVADLPIRMGIYRKSVEEEIRRQFPGQPKDMSYRKEFIAGRGASMKDSTWNRAEHRHDCCGSPVAWRHRAKCKKVAALLSDDLSDLKDIA